MTVRNSDRISTPHPKLVAANIELQPQLAFPDCGSLTHPHFLRNAHSRIVRRSCICSLCKGLDSFLRHFGNLQFLCLGLVIRSPSASLAETLRAAGRISPAFLTSN
ncbi:hypothetical protein KC352_g43 [Hortaea werneckii]|nr:hypothetical protein KC352_g43 [Hortaea werneckii]